MSKTVKLKKGLDIRLVGEAEKVATEFALPKSISIKPADFHGMTPKMAVKEGQEVKAGEVLFYNKYQDSVKVVSPVSGTVTGIIRGEKRRILEVQVQADGKQDFLTHNPIDPSTASSEEVKNFMLASGLWMFIKERPIDVVANPDHEPKAIFVSSFDSSPLAPDYDYILHGEQENFQAGLNALTKLTAGKVYLTLNADSPADSVFTDAKGVEINKISGKHPGGNVGTQIHHLSPMNKGEFVWTVNPQDVALIGKTMRSGKFDSTKLVCLTGSEATHRKYFKTLIGAQIGALVDGNIASDNVRVISGNVLTGDKIAQDGHLGYYHNQITIIPEGNEYKFFLKDGWLGLGFDKFSNSRLFPTWIIPNKKFRLDTNTNGEERAFVVTGELDKVFPFDILPMQLVKAAITQDIDGMENLGIYEVIPEDFALCEYVCTTKINIQSHIREALDLIQSECM
ncbi:MAG: Na(+)-translocating NADH-quinone reductase subunit A [Crocinitomicaceae bacterium]|jgi:Na+-transporting NADH:ubiquinone oxidoreductase subunit A|nr:Na(+)-translocating NADH-quinone reductase subunit A [Crocinitomicaceae bacterium]